MTIVNLYKYSVQVKAVNSTVWREVIKVYTKEIAEKCKADYQKDIPTAQFKVVELF